MLAETLVSAGKPAVKQQRKIGNILTPVQLLSGFVEQYRAGKPYREGANNTADRFQPFGALANHPGARNL